MVGRMTVLRIVIVLVIDNSVTKSYLGVKYKLAHYLSWLYRRREKGVVSNKNARRYERQTSDGLERYFAK